MLKVEHSISCPAYPTHSSDRYYAPIIPSIPSIITRSTITSDGITLSLKVNSVTNKRFVDINGTTCDSISSLIQTAPALQYRLKLLAHAINYLAQDTLFTVIDDPEDFRKKYFNTLKLDYNEHNLCGIGGYGTFDVEEIKDPEVKDNICTFYAKKSNGVPHKVTCSLDKPLIRYEVLRSSFWA